MNENFKPLLIGRDEKKIHQQKKDWEALISSINHLTAKWRGYFSEELDLAELRWIMEDPNLGFYIQSKFVRKNPMYEDFLKKMNVKIDKMVEMVEIPSFDYLVSAVSEVRAMTSSVPGWEQWIKKIQIDGSFSFTDELNHAIIESHSFYTTSERETLALLYLRKFCELLNFWQNIGGSIDYQRLPRPFCFLLSVAPTERRYSSLSRHHSDHPNYLIANFVPSLQAISKDRSLVHLLENLSDEEVRDLTQHFTDEIR